MARTLAPTPGSVRFSPRRRKGRTGHAAVQRSLAHSRLSVTQKASRPTSRAETDETDPTRRRVQ